MTQRLLTRGDRLRLAIAWFGWAGLHTSVNPTKATSERGFAGRETVRALLERFDLWSSPPLTTAPGSYWQEVDDLLRANPVIEKVAFDIGGLLERQHQHTVPERMAGFERFLMAVACGAISEADLMGNDLTWGP